MISQGLDLKLFSLGVFPQEDGAIAVAEKTPKLHINESVYIEKFDSLIECMKFLEKNLEEIAENYISVWKDLENFLDYIISRGEENPDRVCFSEDLRDMFIYRLQELCLGHDVLSSVEEKLRIIDANSEDIPDCSIKTLGRYCTILQYLYAEIRIESKRNSDIKEIVDEYGEFKIRKLLKIAYSLGLFGGADGGVGPRGLNSPYSNFDSSEDRVMDGRGINDKDGGFATHKFLEYNKFRRHPELLMKKNFTYRVKPLMYLKRRLKCRNKNCKDKGKLNVSNTGLVYVNSETDPQYYEWWDEQRNNPYSFDSRGENGVYPSWDTYKQ